MDERDQDLERVKGRWTGFFDSITDVHGGLGCMFALGVGVVLAAETIAVLVRRKKWR